MQILKRTMLILAAFVALAGCHEDDPISLEPAQIRIRNQSTIAIREVYYAGCTEPTFGDNRIGLAIAPGTVRDFTVLPGCYDILVVSTANEEKVMSNAQVNDGQTFTFTITAF
jgi:hypothetical protein